MYEMHGIGDNHVKIVEMQKTIKLTVAHEILSPEEARYVAQKLLRLAERVDSQNPLLPDKSKGLWE